MKRRIFVISDTHFMHENIIRYCSRPFKDALEMDEHMISTWNACVTPQDIIYHLGDVYMGDEKRADALLSRLNGHKRLIVGNHDDIRSPVIMKHFKKIMMWRMFPDYRIVLTHVPIHPSGLEFKVKYNVHGHIHEKEVGDTRYFNASVERIGYAPIPLTDIAFVLTDQN